MTTAKLSYEGKVAYASLVNLYSAGKITALEYLVRLAAIEKVYKI